MAKPNTNFKRCTGVSVSSKQITVIMLICNQFGISKTERGEMLQERYGKSSTADLTSDQAGHFIKEFEGKGFVIKPVPGKKPFTRPASPRPRISRSTGNVIALASREEIEKIYALAGLVEWRVEDGFPLWMEKRMGIKGGMIRTANDAYLAIEGLKKMFENQMKKKHGPAWWGMKFTQQGIRDYIAEHRPKEWRRR